MGHRTTLAVCVALTLGTGTVASAQPADTSASAGQQDTPLLKRFQFDQGGGLHFTPHFAVVFGGIKPGSGMAVGPAISQKLRDGSYVQVKGVYSIRDFKLLQARYDSRPLFHGRSILSTRVRWQDAPILSLYALGPDAPDRRVEYGERKTAWNTVLTAAIAPALVVAGGTGIERYATSAGDLAKPGDTLPFVPLLPGLGTYPWFVHSYIGGSYDTRRSPEYSRTGRLAEGSLHDYHDWHDGQDSFRRVELAAEQRVATFHDRRISDDARGGLVLGARAWLSQSSDSRSVPFFLMPTLGGGNYLRGYSTYRFRDRNALLLSAEYDWAVHKMVDVAARYETGKVAPRVGDLMLDGMAQSAGIGLRIHSKTAGLFRVDLAGGRDGFKLAFGVSAGS